MGRFGAPSLTAAGPAPARRATPTGTEPPEGARGLVPWQGVQGGSALLALLTAPHPAGSRTTNRAPSTAPDGSRRFSAMICPCSASTIWRLIGEAEAGVLAEAFLPRAFGIEPVEDLVELAVRDAGAFVFHHDLRRLPALAAAHRDRPPGGLKDSALPIRLRSTCTSRSSTPRTRSPASGSLSTIRGSVLGAGGVVQFLQGAQHGGDVDLFGHRARQFRIHPRGVATRR